MSVPLRSMVQETRSTAALAVPIISGHLGQMLMGWIDTAMLGRTGVVPLGASGFANTLLSVPMVFGFGLLSAVSVLASRSRGAGENENAAASVRGGFAVAVVLAAAALAATWLALPRLSGFGQPPEVAAASRGYLVISAWSLGPVFLTTVTKNFCEALGRPWQPFWIMLSGVALNAFLNWVLIFGNWGAPAMGLEGAATATLISRVAVTVSMIAYAAGTARLRGSWPKHWFAPGIGSSARGILRIGLPAGTMTLAEISGFAFGSIMMGWISVAAIAAHQIAMTCVATTFMVPLGLAQAVAVRVGHARGSRKLWLLRPIVSGAIVLAAAFMAVMFAVFVFAGPKIAALFIGDPAVRSLAAQLLFLGGVFQIFDGIQAVSSGALRGFEDTKVPMWIGFFSYWVVALPVSYVTAFLLGLGARGIWVGFVCGLVVAAAALVARVAWRVTAVTATLASGAARE